MNEGRADKIKSCYSFLLGVLVIGFLWLLTLRVGQASSFSKGLHNAGGELLTNNPMVSIPIYIIVLTPLIYQILFYILKAFFPTTERGEPYKSKIQRQATQLSGIFLGVFTLTLLLASNHQSHTAKIAFIILSIVWFLLVSVILFYSTAITKTNKDGK